MTGVSVVLRSSGNGTRRCLACCLFLHTGRLVDQPFGRFGVAVEYHILHAFQELRLDLVVDLKHRRIDDSHVKTGLDGVVEEG